MTTLLLLALLATLGILLTVAVMPAGTAREIPPAFYGEQVFPDAPRQSPEEAAREAGL